MDVLCRNLLIGYNAGDEYKPKGIDSKKEYRVVAMESRNRTRQFDGKDKEVTDVFFYVVNDDGKLVRIIVGNCSVRIVQNESKK